MRVIISKKTTMRRDPNYYQPSSVDELTELTEQNVRTISEPGELPFAKSTGTTTGYKFVIFGGPGKWRDEWERGGRSPNLA